MVRTQVQLSKEQLGALKKLAADSGRSVADLVREGVDLLLRSGGQVSEQQQRRRALDAAGRFRSGRHDISEQHDRYLEEAYLE